MRWAVAAVLLQLACGAPAAMDHEDGGATDGGIADMTAAADMGGTEKKCTPPQCQPGYRCQEGSCVVDGDGLWVLTITTGSIEDKNTSGEAWDPLSGLPDPMVCLTIAGNQQCTEYKDNTLSPNWNHSLPAYTASALLLGVTVEILDYDPVGANDVICPKGTVLLRREDLGARSWRARCDQGGFEATLRPQ